MDYDDDDERNDPEGIRILGADAADEQADDLSERRASRAERADEGDAPEPVLRFPLSSDDEPAPPGALPHWTEPPTGATDAVTGETIFDRDDDGSEWSDFAGAPRWRDASDRWDEGDDVRAFAGDPEGADALVEERPDPEDFFTFDELASAPPGRSVFGDDAPEVVDEDGYEYDDDDEDPPRKIVVGGGRVTAGPPPARGPVTNAGVGGDRNIGQAAVVGVAFLAAAIAAFVISPFVATIFITGVVTFAAAELFTKMREVGYQPAALLGVAMTALMVVGTYNAGVAAIPVVLVLSVAFSMFWYLAGVSEGQAVLNIGVTLLGVAWVGMFGSFATALVGIQGPGIPGNPGIGILLAAIIGTIGYDVGGYFVGRSAGRSPLSAASPNKTIEGLAGGCFLAIAAAVIFSLLSGPFDDFADGLKVGVAIAVAAPLGDLSQSMIKRDLGIKDMGSILPGHGGFMDRFDALLFVLPAVYYVASLSDFFL